MTFHGKKPFLLLPVSATGLMTLSMTAATNAASYYISDLGKTEIIGTQRWVTSGAINNTPSTPMVVGTSFAQFRLIDSVSNLTVADMRVTLTGVVGTLDTASGTESGLMIAQTDGVATGGNILNGGSQGLFDSGTLTVLADFSASVSGNQSITLRFDFFEPSTSIPKNLALELTSFDYDYLQYLVVNNSDWTLSADGTNITKTPGPTTTLFSSSSADATNKTASNSIVLNNVADSSFELTMGKQDTGTLGYSLFMFEFRDPSTNLDTPLQPLDPIPEPSAVLFSALGALALLRRRRN